MAAAEASTSSSSQMMGSASVQTLHQWPCSVGLTREAGALLCCAGGGEDANHQTVNLAGCWVAAPGPRPHHEVHDLHTTGRAALRKFGGQLLETKTNPNTLPSTSYQEKLNLVWS